MSAAMNARASTRVDDPSLHSVKSQADDLRTTFATTVSWGAILAGVATGLVTQLILNMIGIGIGASTLDPVSNGSPAASTFSMGAGIWWALSGIVAAFAGAFVASRISGRADETTGGWHGLTSWAVTTLLVVYLLTTVVGSLVGGAFNTVSSAIGGLGRTVGTAVQASTGNMDPFSSIESMVRRTSGTDPGAMRDDAVSALRDLMTGDAAKANDARERAAQAVSRSQNIPVEEARTRIASYEKQYHDTVDAAKRSAAQAADTAASAVSRGALWASLALVLGALAAWFGGRTGTINLRVTATDTARRSEPSSAR